MDRYSVDEAMREMDEEVDALDEFSVMCMLTRWRFYGQSQELGRRVMEAEDEGGEVE